MVLSNFTLLIWGFCQVVSPREDKTEDNSPSDIQVCGNSVTDGNTFLKENKS
jgi:hypothetical protein